MPDVVVYGGTAAGVMAAVAAARRGAAVALLEPSRHVGGMVSGGLGRSDVERQEPLIGGLALEFARRIGRVYGAEVAWRFEPSVAERILGDLLEEQRVEVRLGWELADAGAAGAGGNAGGGPSLGRPIGRVVDAAGEAIDARAFVDATYEGDLLAAAGVSHAVGREGVELYGEGHAGRRELLPSPHQFTVPVSPLANDGADGTLLPGFVAYDELAPPGGGDHRVQSYCYRVCLSDRPDRIPIPAPPRYDPDRYELVRRYAAALGDRVSFRTFGGPGRLPNGKADLNSDGPVSTKPPRRWPGLGRGGRGGARRDRRAPPIVGTGPPPLPRDGGWAPDRAASRGVGLGPAAGRVPRHRALAAPAVRPGGPADARAADPHGARPVRGRRPG